MNRAVALRIAACGIMGLGAALLIAALLLSTYTNGKITKIPLDLDATLVSDGTGNGVRPGVTERRTVRRRQERAAVAAAAGQRGGAVERRRRHPAGRHARCAAPTSSRTTACCWPSSTPSPSTARPRWRSPARAIPAAQCRSRAPSRTTSRRPTSRCRTRGWRTASRSTPRRRRIPYFDPIAQKAFDANYDGEEDVNGLTTYRFTQNVGYDADGKLVEPVKYASLYDDDEDSQVTARAALWGLPGDPERADHDDPLLRRAAHVLGGSGVGHHRQDQGARRTTTTRAKPSSPR